MARTRKSPDRIATLASYLALAAMMVAFALLIF